MNRTQFTFYESFYRSISRIKKAADRVKAYDALCAYALYGEIPDLDSAPDSVASFFESIKPILDSAAKKAAAGKKGGSAKQAESTGKQPEASGSKSEANGSKPEARNRTRNRTSTSTRTNVTPLTPLSGASPKLQAAFSEWLDYKRERREPYKPTGLKALETEVLNNAALYGEEAVASLIRSCMASNWRGIIFDRLREGKSGSNRNQETGFQTSNPFLELLEEERGMR